MTAAGITHGQVESDRQEQSNSNAAVQFSSFNPCDTETHNQIAQLAYVLWLKRGRRSDSAQTDWYEAETLIRKLRRSQR